MVILSLRLTGLGAYHTFMSSSCVCQMAHRRELGVGVLPREIEMLHDSADIIPAICFAPLALFPGFVLGVPVWRKLGLRDSACDKPIAASAA